MGLVYCRLSFLSWVQFSLSNQCQKGKARNLFALSLYLVHCRFSVFFLPIVKITILSKFVITIPSLRGCFTTVDLTKLQWNSTLCAKYGCIVYHATHFRQANYKSTECNRHHSIHKQSSCSHTEANKRLASTHKSI